MSGLIEDAITFAARAQFQSKVIERAVRQASGENRRPELDEGRG